MARTTSNLVQNVLLDEYGPREDGTDPDLAPFIAMASLVVSRVAACAIRKGTPLSDDELEMVERLLAAHAYKMTDQAASSTSTEGSSASFQGQTGLNLDGTKFGQMAQMVDHSFCLSNMSKQQRASLVWMGKAPSDQVPLNQRD